MPINKQALIRYKTIDNCLQNRFRKWTLEDLIEACSDALYEYEGITRGISRRTIQLDIQNMRSEKLGYNAPIVVTDKKFYSYEEKGFSITNTPLTQQDLGTLNEVLDVLKQFKGFGYFQEINGMVTRLEDKLYKQQHKGKSYIDFEKNELLKGLEFIDPIHQAIRAKKSLAIHYKSFKAREAARMVVFAYLLKEYRNRWFMLGATPKGLINLALDRMVSVEEASGEKYVKPDFDVFSFYDDTIGVTKMHGQKPQQIVFRITEDHAPYLLTKPMHSSQKLLKQDKGGSIFSIEVIWNFEVERELLGFGEHLQVLAPKKLVKRMASRVEWMVRLYKDK